jgi:hypothetical protein
LGNVSPIRNLEMPGGLLGGGTELQLALFGGADVLQSILQSLVQRREMGQLGLIARHRVGEMSNVWSCWPYAALGMVVFFLPLAPRS